MLVAGDRVCSTLLQGCTYKSKDPCKSSIYSSFHAYSNCQKFWWYHLAYIEKINFHQEPKKDRWYLKTMIALLIASWSDSDMQAVETGEGEEGNSLTKQPVLPSMTKQRPCMSSTRLTQVGIISMVTRMINITKHIQIIFLKSLQKLKAKTVVERQKSCNFIPFSR